MFQNDNMRMLHRLHWIIFSALLLALLVVPERPALFIDENAPDGLPDLLPAGEVFQIDPPNGYAHLSINGRPLLRLAGIEGWLGAVGINERGRALLSGIRASNASSIQVRASSWWRTHVIYGFAKEVTTSPQDELDKATQLRLPASKRQEIDSGDEGRKRIEGDEIFRASYAPEDPPRFTCWMLPIDSKITSEFGRARLLASGKRYFHTGTDLRASVGTPVRAAAAGTVTLTAEMLIPGQVIVLQHGGGFATRYMHMSEIQVKEGQRVQQGEILGLSGDSGRVNGPHLHWEALWQGQHINPLQTMKILQRPCDPA